MTDKDNTSLLWAFCAAANHVPTCNNWENHRFHLENSKKLIDALLESIPTAIAIGKASQSAARNSQTTLIGENPVPPKEIEDHRNPAFGPAKVKWMLKHLTAYSGYYKLDDKGTPTWVTEDDNVTGFRRLQYHKEDCRAASIEAYKPRQVEIYFDGEPDEWNGKR